MADFGLTFQTEFPCSLGTDTWLLVFRGSFVLLNNVDFEE